MSSGIDENDKSFELHTLLSEIKQCSICSPFLPHGVNPVVAAKCSAKIAIVGQAPGSEVHKTGVPWNDKSGKRLREWLGVSDTDFYNPALFALIPMGFCYPGKGKSGDLPPRPECAPTWHKKLFKELQGLQTIILIGSYAQTYYLANAKKRTLTETVKNYTDYLPDFLPLPHPSPRNNIWLKKNPWFPQEVLPYLKRHIQNTIKR